ncbi:MAG: ferritin-like domain-containing protein, partial [Pseudomonadota bacterium]
LDVDTDYSCVPRSVARSLAIFQLGESGGGTVVEQVADSALPGLDQYYARAVRYFVAEEHRHAALLAMCVRVLGGKLLKKNWTATCFVKIRRFMGLRFKVLVLLAAEVVGLCYYQLLASRLPQGQVRTLLRDIAADERAHLKFHSAFLRTQCCSRLNRAVFLATWRTVMFATAVAVLLDHYRAIRDLGIPVRRLWYVWWAYANLAETSVLGSCSEFSEAIAIDLRAS